MENTESSDMPVCVHMCVCVCTCVHICVYVCVMHVDV